MGLNKRGEYKLENLNHLYEIWKSRNYDLQFYFQKIFQKALNALTNRVNESSIKLKEGENSRYKALFVPVGFSIENVALISALFRPDYLTLAFSEITMRFHRRHIDLVKGIIKERCPNIKIINEVTTLSDDQKSIEQKIVEWVEEMTAGYGLSNNQLAVDLTGGTTPMSIGAHNAALSFEGINAFYLKADYDEDTEEPIPGTERLIQILKEKSQVDDEFVFVIMPFAEEFNDIYELIKEVVESSGLRCLRVDKEIFIGGIMDKVKENIIKAKFIIADLSDKNENVYYELGLSHGFGKKVIMLTQDLSKIPFDLKHLRMVIYKHDNISEFKKQLGDEIKHIKNLD